MEALLRLSGLELARGIRAREFTAGEVVAAHIARLRAVGPRLNAVVRQRFAGALAEARRVDERLRAGLDEPPPPYWGVPCTIKEAFAVTGMPWSAGLVARGRTIAGADATGVARLRAAGAIVLGVTNTSELCMWMEAANRVYGRTANPYAPGRIAGGSSGGEGAVIGAGGSPFGLGADVGGSIRMPAFFCGVFGHKPSGGLVPNSGQFPIARGEALRMLTTGPLCRRAADLMPLLRILAGPDGRDAECRRRPLGDPAQLDLARLRVLDVAGDGWLPVAPALRRAQRRAAAALAAAGARVRPARFSGLRWSLLIWAAELAARDGGSYRARLGQGVPIGRARELARWLVGRSAHTLPSLGLAAIEQLTAGPQAIEARARQAGARLREELVAALGADGVMLYPSHPRPAPRHNAPLLRPFAWTYTAVFNALELPVTQVPLGLGPGGLPLGVQVVAGPGRDHLGIAVALALERACGGWVWPGAQRA